MITLVNFTDWSRKHALMSALLLMVLITGYYFGHKHFVAPAEAIAADIAEIPVPEAPPALSDEEKASVDAAVPNGNSVEVISELAKIAEPHGVRVFSLESGSSGPGAQVYRGDLASESYVGELAAKDAKSIGAFLADVSKNPRYMRTDSARMKQDADGVRLDMSLTVFFQE